MMEDSLTFEGISYDIDLACTPLITSDKIIVYFKGELHSEGSDHSSYYGIVPKIDFNLTEIRNHDIDILPTFHLF